MVIIILNFLNIAQLLYKQRQNPQGGRTCPVCYRRPVVKCQAAPAARAGRRKDAMRLISCEVQFVPDINFIQCVKFVVLNYSTQRLDDRKGC